MEFSILKYLKNSQYSTNLSATFLCQFNGATNFLNNPKHEITNNFFDFSHKFLIEIPIYITAKISIFNILYLIENLNQDMFDKFVTYLKDDWIRMSAPETNLQPIISLVILTARTWNDLNFFKQLQKIYDCFYDFDFIDTDQHLYMETNFNPGQIFLFKNLLDTKIHTKYNKSNANISIGKYSTSNLFKYSFSLICPSSDNMLFRKQIKSIFVGSDSIFSPVNGIINSWTSVTYDCEMGRLEYFRNRKTLTNPLDSYVQVVCCVSHSSFNQQMRYSFINVREKSFLNEIMNYKKENETNNCFFFIFLNEKDLLEAIFLFLQIFNMIIDFNGLNYDAPFLVHRYNILVNNLDYINYVQLKPFPNSIKSPTKKILLIECECKTKLKYKTNARCFNCGKIVNLKKDNAQLEYLKGHYKDSNTFNLSVHLDLLDDQWKPNKVLSQKTINSKLNTLATYWFRRPISHFSSKNNTITLYSVETDFNEYKKWEKFGKCYLVWFDLDKDKNEIKMRASGLLVSMKFYKKELNSEQNERCSPILTNRDDHSDCNYKGYITYNFICEYPDQESSLENSFLSYSKIDIDTDKQINPTTPQDYIDIIKYCMMDTFLTSQLSIQIKNHTYCFNSMINQLPIYKCYNPNTGILSNYHLTQSKYGKMCFFKNQSMRNIYYCKKNLEFFGKKADDNNLESFKYGKASKIPVATSIEELNENDIYEPSLKLFNQESITSIKDLERIIEKIKKNDNNEKISLKRK